jgi:hypothetical protein
MRAIVYVAAFVCALWIPFVLAETRARTGVDVWRAPLGERLRAIDVPLASLLLFNAVNVLICAWEIALWKHRDVVIARHEGYLKKFGDKVRSSARAARETKVG